MNVGLKKEGGKAFFDTVFICIPGFDVARGFAWSRETPTIPEHASAC